MWRATRTALQNKIKLLRDLYSWVLVGSKGWGTPLWHCNQLLAVQMPETAPRDHRGRLGVTCTDASSAVDFDLPALTPGITARSARHPGCQTCPRPHPLLPLGKQGMSIPAQEGQSSMQRVADLLVRGLSSSSFCFFEITWKTQGKETLEPSLVITDKHMENWVRVRP